jgi:1-acyl-sn-glycerol-3-phosphate acyltransferase
MSEQSQFALLRARRFLPFFLTQFLGAFNDNVFKNALQLMIAFELTTLAGLAAETWVNLAAGLFILPYFLFSATAGQIADKLEKSRLIRITKVLELVIMAVAAIAFLVGNISWLLVLLFLMGVQATLFGPVKYGIMPQHLKETELVGGNALVDTGTFVAILLGMILGGLYMTFGDLARPLTAGTLVVLAVLGYLASRRIPYAAPSDPGLKINLNPFSETWRNFQFARRNRAVFLSLLGISWFWLFGSLFLTQLPSYAKLVLHGDQSVAVLLSVAVTVGIAVGSLLCERLSGHKVEIGLVPFGSIGLTIFAADLYFAHPIVEAAAGRVAVEGFLAQPGARRVLIDLALIGVFGGFYSVPLYAMVLQRSEPSHRSRIIACNNIINAMFMVAAAGLAILLLNVGLTIPQLFLVAAALNALVAIYIYTLVPEFLMRFLIWILVSVLYRVRAHGLEHIPDEGAAVLVSNHVSFMDALVIGGTVRRPVRFVMDHNIFKIPVLSFIFRTARAIPIAPAREDAAALAEAYDRIDAELADDNVVCIFPEGKLTADGEMNVFRKGVEQIIGRRPVPVVPMALQGLWGSIFSRKGGAALSRWPRRFWLKIGLVAGAPVPASVASAELLEQRVRALRGERR